VSGRGVLWNASCHATWPTVDDAVITSLADASLDRRRQNADDSRLDGAGAEPLERRRATVAQRRSVIGTLVRVWRRRSRLASARL